MACDLPNGGYKKRSDLDGTAKIKSACLSHPEQWQPITFKKKSSIVSLTISQFPNTIVFTVLISLR